MTTPQGTTHPLGLAEADALAVVFAILDKVEELCDRQARTEAILEAILAGIDEHTDLEDQRFAATVAGLTARQSGPGGLDVLAAQVHAVRYASTEELPDVLRNAASALYWHVAKGVPTADRALAHLHRATEGRLDAQAVASLVVPILNASQRRR